MRFEFSDILYSITSTLRYSDTQINKGIENAFKSDRRISCKCHERLPHRRLQGTTVPMGGVGDMNDINSMDDISDMHDIVDMSTRRHN